MSLLQRWVCRGLLLFFASTAVLEAEEKAFGLVPCWVPISGNIDLALDYFRAIPDGSWQENLGGLLSFNVGMPAPLFSRDWVGLQLGGSYGVYDWQGRESNIAGSFGQVQHQGFLTIGLFKQAPRATGLSVALAYDFMFNKNFGEMALHPTLMQLRGLASWLCGCWGEFGLWATLHTNTVRTQTVLLPISFRAINQVNLFYRCCFEERLEGVICGGVPVGKSLMGLKRPGRFTLGLTFSLPLVACWRFEARAAYTAPPHAPPPFSPSRLYAANVMLGISYRFNNRRALRSCYRPYLPVANNSNFLTDVSFSN